MKLFELTGEFRDLYEAVEQFEDEPDAWFDTLEAIQGEIDDKILNCARIVESERAEVKALKELEERIHARRKAKENGIERLKGYMMHNMEVTGKKRVDDIDLSVSIRATPEGIRFDTPAREEEFLTWACKYRDDLVKYAKPTLNKTALKESIQRGQSFEGISLEKGQTLSIR